MEIAKFILTAVGTFLSVFALSFTVFQYWKKKQDEKIADLKNNIENSIQGVRASVDKEANARNDALERVDKRIEFLERGIVHGFENRLSTIEGELRGIKPILKSIQDWFINNTPSGSKK